MKKAPSKRKKTLIRQKYQDSFADTLKKIPLNKFTVEAALEVIPASISNAVSLVADETIGVATGVIAYHTLDWMISTFTHVYETGEARLSTIFGGTIPDATYNSVSEFWAKVEQHGLSHGALIEITGLLSPYGPLTPSHPMSRPGYSIGGWKKMGDLKADSTEEYDNMDALIYGDRVIRLSKPRYNTYYAGLYDVYYGLANVAIPLYLDTRHTRHFYQWGLPELWKLPLVGGKIVTLKGRLRKISNYYSQLKKEVPSKYRMLPSYGLEVFEITYMHESDGITHISASIGWDEENQERMMTNYFNIQDRQEFSVSEHLLEKTRKQKTNLLLFNYDDVSCLSKEWKHKLPKYNELLQPWLSGTK